MALTYENVVDDSILVHFEAQNAFSDFITEATGGGSDHYQIDLAKQQITFEPTLHKRDEVVCRLHLLASVAAQPHSVLWAWANPQFAERPVAALSERVRDFGADNQISEFAEGEWQLPEDADDAHIAQQVAAVGCRITGMPVGLVTQAGSTQVVFALDPAGFALGEPDATTFPRVVLGPIGHGDWVFDHRRAVQGYAQARRIPHGWASGFTGIQLRFPQGPVTVDFDEAGRVGEVHAELG